MYKHKNINSIPSTHVRDWIRNYVSLIRTLRGKRQADKSLGFTGHSKTHVTDWIRNYVFLIPTLRRKRQADKSLGFTGQSV